MENPKEQIADDAAATGEDNSSRGDCDRSRTAKTANTAILEDTESQTSSDEHDRRWGLFSLSRKRRDKSVEIFKAVIVFQMIAHPLVAWAFHFFAYYESAAKYFNAAGDLIDRFPYWASFGVIVCSLAWLWRRAHVPVCSGLGLAAAYLSGMLSYYRCYHPEKLTQSEAHVISFWAAAWFLYIASVWWLGQRRLRCAARLQREDAEKIKDQDKDVDLSGYGRTSLATMYRVLNRTTPTQRLFRTKLASRFAFAFALLFDFVTLIYIPPDRLTDYLSTLNCEVNVEDLHQNGMFFEFTTRPKTNSSPFRLTYCPQTQQWLALTREMDKRAFQTLAASAAYKATKAAWAAENDWEDDGEIDYDQPSSCLAFCFRAGENDQLLGFMSRPLGPEDLPEMIFCRGEYGYLGDCERTGRRLGFNVTKEGWMNDYLGWVHDEGDGPEGERWDANRKVHWNGVELEFPPLKKEGGEAGGS